MKKRITQSELYSEYPHILEHLTGLVKPSVKSTLSHKLIHLVKLRASQINQCGFCQHMHAEEARESDENQSRLDVLSAWRELDCFSFEERTALAWTEALTLIHSSTITEEMYNSVESTFGKEGLIELTSIILQYLNFVVATYHRHVALYTQQRHHRRLPQQNGNDIEKSVWF